MRWRAHRCHPSYTVRRPPIVCKLPASAVIAGLDRIQMPNQNDFAAPLEPAVSVAVALIRTDPNRSMVVADDCGDEMIRQAHRIHTRIRPFILRRYHRRNLTRAGHHFQVKAHCRLNPTYRLSSPGEKPASARGAVAGCTGLRIVYCSDPRPASTAYYVPMPSMLRKVYRATIASLMHGGTSI